MLRYTTSTSKTNISLTLSTLSQITTPLYCNLLHNCSNINQLFVPVFELETNKRHKRTVASVVSKPFKCKNVELELKIFLYEQKDTKVINKTQD